MADDRTRQAANHTNDPVTSPEAQARNPKQSEVNASRMDREEAASRAHATQSGRSAAKWFGIGLAVLIVVLVVGGFAGGGSWIWGTADPDPALDAAE